MRVALFIAIFFSSLGFAKPINLNLLEVNAGSNPGNLEVKYELVFQVYEENSGYIESQNIEEVSRLRIEKANKVIKLPKKAGINLEITDAEIDRIKEEILLDYPAGTRLITYRLNVIMFPVGQSGSIAFGSAHLLDGNFQKSFVESEPEDPAYFKALVY